MGGPPQTDTRLPIILDMSSFDGTFVWLDLKGKQLETTQCASWVQNKEVDNLRQTITQHINPLLASRGKFRSACFCPTPEIRISAPPGKHSTHEGTWTISLAPVRCHPPVKDRWIFPRPGSVDDSESPEDPEDPSAPSTAQRCQSTPSSSLAWHLAKFDQDTLANNILCSEAQWDSMGKKGILFCWLTLKGNPSPPKKRAPLGNWVWVVATSINRTTGIRNFGKQNVRFPYVNMGSKWCEMVFVHPQQHLKHPTGQFRGS